MRSEDEEEEDEYEEELEGENDNDNEEDENRMEIDGEDGDERGRSRSADAEGDVDAVDGEGDMEDEEEVEVDAEVDGEGSDDQAGQDDEDDDEDPDPDPDPEGEGEGDEDDSDPDADADADADDADGDEDEDDEGDEDDAERIGDVPSSPIPSNISPPKRSSSPTLPPLPPYKIRRSLFIPSFAPSTRPSHLTVEAIVAIPVPSPIHCLAASTCSSYLLTGSQEGVVRAYDFYGSVNGQQMMTAQQRSVVGMGESIGKAGVGRGWWVSDVPGGEGEGEGNGRKAEPVYSLAVEGDGLWALTGAQSGLINMYTLRHSPGQLVYSIKGHSSVVSCMTLTTDEEHLLSGSWDGSIREWDLNTGQTSRSYPTHGAQLSSLSLRPYGHPITPSASPRPHATTDENEVVDVEMENKPHISVSVGADFFEPKPAPISPNPQPPSSTTTQGDAASVTVPPTNTESETPAESSVLPPAESRASSHDSLFGDDDADGETVPPSKSHTPIPQSSTSAAGPSRLLLAIPNGQPRSNGHSTANAPKPDGAAGAIPLLSPTTYKQFSDDVMLASFMDGQVMLVDRRVPSHGNEGIRGVGRLSPGDKAPPWCMSACWSGNGNQILAGRRNGTIDIWDVRRTSSSTAPNLLHTLKTPVESGAVSCVVAFPDGQHIATASQDNIRLWNTNEYFDNDESSSFRRVNRSRPPFKIVSGHHGGTVSAMLVDPTCRFMTVASGDRGWAGESTKVVLIHEIKW